MTDYPKTLAEATAILQTRLPEVKRSQTAHVEMKAGGSFDYDYADLANVSDAVLPILGELGLSFIAFPTLNADGKFVLAYKLLHVSGEFEPGEYPLGGNTPQATGSYITYARRQCLCAATGVAPAGDDDAAAAQAEADKTRGTVQRQRAVARPAPRTVGEAADRPTVARARPAGPPLPGEAGLITSGQLKAVNTLLTKLGIEGDDNRHAKVSEIVNEPVESLTKLTETEAGTVITKLGEKVNAKGQ